MNLNRRPCIHACRTRLTANMFTVRAIAYPNYAIFMSGGRWRYRLSIIQHVTELQSNAGRPPTNGTKALPDQTRLPMRRHTSSTRVFCKYVTHTYHAKHLAWTISAVGQGVDARHSNGCPPHVFFLDNVSYAYPPLPRTISFVTTLVPFRCCSVTLCVNYFCSVHDCGAWPLLAVREIAGMALVMRTAMHACRTHW